jgi:hypothetical protein
MSSLVVAETWFRKTTAHLNSQIGASWHIPQPSSRLFKIISTVQKPKKQSASYRQITTLPPNKHFENGKKIFL